METPVKRKNGDPALVDGTLFILKSPFISHERFQALLSSLHLSLERLGRQDFREALTYVINEMINNAEKANIKRLYFREKGLDMGCSTDYCKGMDLLSRESSETWAMLRPRLDENGFYTRLSLHIEDDVLIINTANNSLPTEEELDRIHSRVERTATIRDIADAYMTIYDETEGAGFGIVSTVLMFRSLGVHDTPYRFTVDQAAGESIAEVRLPLSAVSDRHIEHISGEIIQEIEAIPKLPGNVMKIAGMLSDPDSAFSDVSRVILRDPALTADLLRMVNSAQFMLSKKVTSIQHAISLIGVRELRNLLYQHGADKILNARYKNLNDLWAHSHQCAFYAAELARRYRLGQMADDVYTSGILHDIGKIILEALHKDLVERIYLHCEEMGMPGNFIESLTVGIGHARIGAMIGRHWNFPEDLVNTIEYHHQPFLAPEEYASRAYVVCLSDLLAKDFEGDVRLRTIGPEVFDFFNIKDESELKALSQNLAMEFREHFG